MYSVPGRPCTELLREVLEGSGNWQKGSVHQCIPVHQWELLTCSLAKASFKDGSVNGEGIRVQGNACCLGRGKENWGRGEVSSEKQQ